MRLAHDYLSHLRERLHALEDKRLQLREKRYSGEVSKNAYAEVKEALERKKEAVRQTLEYTNNSVIRYIQNVI